jgi:hypothetical protein
MHRARIVAVAAMIVTVGGLAGFVIPAAAQSVTAFEGARLLIVGDGRVIENATWSWTARGSLTLEGPPTFVSLPAPGA